MGDTWPLQHYNTLYKLNAAKKDNSRLYYFDFEKDEIVRKYRHETTQPITVNNKYLLYGNREKLNKIRKNLDSRNAEQQYSSSSLVIDDLIFCKLAIMSNYRTIIALGLTNKQNYGRFNILNGSKSFQMQFLYHINVYGKPISYNGAIDMFRQYLKRFSPEGQVVLLFEKANVQSLNVMGRGGRLATLYLKERKSTNSCTLWFGSTTYRLELSTGFIYLKMRKTPQGSLWDPKNVERLFPL